MPYLAPNQVDDFLESVKHKYIVKRWKDISMPLQEYMFASRLFSKAEPDTMEGDLVTWRLQIANNDTFTFTGLYADDVTKRQDLLTHGNMGWSMSTANYTYDTKEKVFRTSPVEIIDYMLTLEHSMNNSYFKGMELAMMSAGPTSPTQTKPPPTSLLWWIQPYSTSRDNALGTNGYNTTGYTLPTGTTSGFYGMNAYGFDSVGTGGIDRKAVSGWRNRVGQYTSFTEDDAVDTIIECIDKCNFHNAHSYPDLSGNKRPTYELLTTYATVKKARKLLQAGNDNIRNALDTWKIDAPMLRNSPMIWVPAWSNQDFGTARTDGLVMGVDWSTFHWYSAAGLRRVRNPPYQDKDKHSVRWVTMDDSGQLVCLDCRRNFAVTCTATVTEQN